MRKWLIVIVAGFLVVVTRECVSVEDARVCSKWPPNGANLLVQIRESGPSYIVKVPRDLYMETFEDDTLVVYFFGDVPVHVRIKHPYRP